MNIVITGGSGFVGSYLCENLIDDGHKIIVIDNLLTGSTENINNLMEPTKILKTEYEELHNAVENGKHEYHCFYLATVNLKTPRLRTVVIRSIDKDENSISFHTDLRSTGIWVGLLTGLTASAIMLYLRFNYLTKKLIAALKDQSKESCQEEEKQIKGK